MNMLIWPPPYVVRRSERARRIALRVKPGVGLEIVLPKRAAQRDGLYFLQQNRAWVEKNAMAIQQAAAVQTPDSYTLPSVIELHAIGRTWQISYQHYTLAKRVILQRINQELVLSGCINDFRDCASAFKVWLLQQAHYHLTPWLQRLSEECQLPFSNVSYRSQKKRWGSCSEDKSISLNYKLLFLPPELVRYVLVHELCHTRELSHGAEFWYLVQQFVPTYRELKKALHKADQWLPSWQYIV